MPPGQVYSQIKLGPLTDLRVGVVIMPMATVLSLLADVAGKPQRVPPHWRQRVRSALPAHAHQALVPLFGSAVSNIPHCLTPSVSVRDADFDTHLEQIAAAAEQRLTDELEQLHGHHMPAAWRPVMRRPGPWIRSYTEAMRCAWNAFQPLWRRAKPLLEREITRVGTASIRGALDAVLATLNPRWRYSAQQILIPDPQPETFLVGGRRLVLTPIISGMGASVFDPDCRDMVWLGYPVPGLNSLWHHNDQDDVVPRQDRLELVLGPMRARLVRLLGRPLSMRQLAHALGCAPSVATYHCSQLADAGLLHRVRRGREVLVERTELGGALLDLLGTDG